MTERRIYTYRIDGEDRITFVNPEWEEFARQNDAPQLVDPGVLGKPLQSFIADIETKHLYQVILSRVRKLRTTMLFSYRCDAPDRRRFMEMAVHPWGLKGVEFNNWIVREEPRGPIRLLLATAARSQQLIKICSWCNRIAAPEWLEVEAGIEHLRLFTQDHMPQITHGMCEDCYRSIQLTLN